jgi:hypothetical protein
MQLGIVFCLLILFLAIFPLGHSAYLHYKNNQTGAITVQVTPSTPSVAIASGASGTTTVAAAAPTPTQAAGTATSEFMTVNRRRL